MALYTIADLHLSFGSEKPMDVFGGNWSGYVEKIEQNLGALLEPGDTLVLGGDFSWSIDLEGALPDFQFLARFPGRKILLKGNHDLWWETVSKMCGFLQKNQLQDIEFLHNNCFTYGDIALCGTRGWFYEESFQQQHDEKIFRREIMRLERSLEEGRKTGARRLFCFLHYPPIYEHFRCSEIMERMKYYGVEKCIFGHLHGPSLSRAVTGWVDGVEYLLVSGDYLNFRPILLEK